MGSNGVMVSARGERMASAGSVGAWRGLTIAYCALLLACLIAVAASPVAFQKTNSIVGARFEGALANVSTERSLDVAALIGSIPYAAESEMVWEVNPEKKFERTIGEGEGNCSNLIFGLAYYLDRHGIDYHIVHLMQPDIFLDGHGHTVVRVNYQYRGETRIGIVDVADGGLPMRDSRFLDLPDLEQGSLPGVSMESLNSHREPNLKFYRESLDEIVVGLIPAEELDHYFAFIERIYLPLGSEPLEKFLYDGLAVLFGAYPTIYVEEIGRAKAGNELRWVFHRGALWMFRSAAVVLPLIAWSELRRRRPRSAARRASARS